VALLEARGIAKSFGGIHALSQLSLHVESGEAVGLVGPNGAGKTTLFNCLNGVERPDTGTVVFAGHRIDGLPIHRRARLGIGRTFQRLELFSGLTVRDHLLVAERVRRSGGRMQVWKDLLDMGAPTPQEQADVDKTLDVLGLLPIADTVVDALTLGQGRLVELGRALAGKPSLLMLDEPSSGLDTSEASELAGVLNRIRYDSGTAILLVEHDMDMVHQVVSRLYVLDLGHLIAEGEIDQVLADPKVRTAYLGQGA